MKRVSDEMLMLYIWEGINDTLGTDPDTVTEEAATIYNGIKQSLETARIIEEVKNERKMGQIF